MYGSYLSIIYVPWVQFCSTNELSIFTNWYGKSIKWHDLPSLLHIGDSTPPLHWRQDMMIDFEDFVQFLCHENWSRKRLEF